MLLGKLLKEDDIPLEKYIDDFMILDLE